MKLTKEQKFKLLQLCSGHFLTAPYPDDWQNLKMRDKNEFIERNRWWPFEHDDVEEIETYIADATKETIETLSSDAF